MARSNHVQLRIEPALARQIDEHATRLGITRSAAIRDLCRYAVGMRNPNERGFREGYTAAIAAVSKTLQFNLQNALVEAQPELEAMIADSESAGEEMTS